MIPFQSDFSHPDDDHDLVAQVADGDVMALAKLYDRHAVLIHSLSLRILEDAGEATEVTCEVFLCLVGNAWQYQRSGRTLPVWLSTLARNRAVGRLRLPGRFQPRPEALERTAEGGRDPVSIRHSPSEPATLVDQLQEAVAALPEEQRQVLELAWFGGLTPQEIAAEMGLTPEAVRTGLRLPRQRVRSPIEGPVG